MVSSALDVELEVLIGNPGASQVALVVKKKKKKPPPNAGGTGFTPGAGRSLGERNSYLLQYCCLENPMDRAAWQMTAHTVIQSGARVKGLSTHACMGNPHSDDHHACRHTCGMTSVYMEVTWWGQRSSSD